MVKAKVPGDACGEGFHAYVISLFLPLILQTDHTYNSFIEKQF
jgi:hypothetical protein